MEPHYVAQQNKARGSTLWRGLPQKKKLISARLTVTHRHIIFSPPIISFASCQRKRQQDHLTQCYLFLTSILPLHPPTLQDRVSVNAHRFSDAITGLRSELENAELARMSGITNLANLQEVSLQIRDDIMSLRGVAEQQAAEEIKLMDEAFAKQIKSKVEEVERERNSRKNKTGEWIGKNKVLQQEVDRQLTLTEAKHTAAKKLKETRKLLSVEHSAQLEDKEILIRQSLSLQTHNKKLRERIGELESIIHSLQTTIIPDGTSNTVQGHPGASLSRTTLENQAAKVASNSGNRSGGSHQACSNEERFKRYEQTLAKYKVILEAERKNLEAVRSAHVQALQQRTELEVLLKEALNWGILESRKIAGDPERSYLDEAGRQSVVERLLSNDRVLQHLYGKDAVGEGVKGNTETLPPPASSDVDMSELWDKWKQWTETAK